MDGQPSLRMRAEGKLTLSTHVCTVFFDLCLRMRKRTTERREVRVYTGGRSDQYHKAGGMKPQETWSLTVLFISIATSGVSWCTGRIVVYRHDISVTGPSSAFTLYKAAACYACVAGQVWVHLISTLHNIQAILAL